MISEYLPPLPPSTPPPSPCGHLPTLHASLFFHCQAEDAIARVLAMDETNLPALMLHALQGLTQSGQVLLES